MFQSLGSLLSFIVTILVTTKLVPFLNSLPGLLGSQALLVISSLDTGNGSLAYEVAR